MTAFIAVMPKKLSLVIIQPIFYITEKIPAVSVEAEGGSVSSEEEGKWNEI